MSVLRGIVGFLLAILLGVVQANAVDQSICNPGSKVVLSPDGSLESCLLKDTLSINGIRCSEKRPISFYPDGQLESCNLAESATVDSQQCKQFDPISFYPDGKFKSCIKKE